MNQESDSRWVANEGTLDGGSHSPDQLEMSICPLHRHYLRHGSCGHDVQNGWQPYLAHADKSQQQPTKKLGMEELALTERGRFGGTYFSIIK